MAKYTHQQCMKTVYNPGNGKYYSQAQLEEWATQITKIGTNTGRNKDRKMGRAKGRYIKGKI